MLKLQPGDQIELFYEDAPASTIRARVDRLLTDRDEGMGVEVAEYVACWLEITVDKPSNMDARQIVLLGTDFQCRLNGRPVTVRKASGPRGGGEGGRGLEWGWRWCRWWGGVGRRRGL